MNTIDLHDDDLANRLRATLADQAATITGPPPALPDTDASAELALVGPPPVPRRGRQVARWVAAAAAVVVLGGGVAVARHGTDGRTVRGTASAPPTAPYDPAQGPAASLPPGFDLWAASPIFEGKGKPENADNLALAYLADRLGDGEVEVEQRLRTEIELQPTTTIPGSPAISVIGWSQDGPGSEPKEHLPRGTLYLRQTQDRWEVVASVTDGLSLHHVVRDAAGVHGHLTVTGDYAPMNNPGLDVVDGLEGKSLFPDSDPLPPNQPVLGEQSFAVDVHGMFPVGVRATLVGGRTLGISEISLDPSVIEDVVWPVSADAPESRRDPISAATAFVESATDGKIRVDVGEATVDGATRRVHLVLDGHLDVTVHLVRRADGWVVFLAYDGRSEVSTAFDTAADGGKIAYPQIPRATARAEAIVMVDGRWQHRSLAQEDLVRSGPNLTEADPHQVYARLAFAPEEVSTGVVMVGRNRGGKLTTFVSMGWTGTDD